MREMKQKKGAIAAVMGWTLPYTLGVLGRWKILAVYCRAVLCYGQRIGPDGAAAEAADAEARHLAANRDAGHGPRADTSWDTLWAPSHRLAGQAAIWQSSVSFSGRFCAMFE
jgi:hypothetical protein